MTKATEIKLEEDRDDSKGGLSDRWRGMKLVPFERSGEKGRAFNIDVADNLFSPHVSPADRSGSTGTSKSRSAVETKPGTSARRVPDAFRTETMVGIFIAAGLLGFLIGRMRD